MPTNTATETAPPEPTRILPATETPTPTSEETRAPSLPQQAEDEIPTATNEADVIIQREFEPTPPDVPTLDNTELARLLATAPPRATPTAQQAQASPEPATLATPDASLTQAADQIFNPTPGDATPPAAVGVRDLPPTATATRFQPTVAVQPDLIPPTIALVSVASTFSTNNASVYQFDVAPSQQFTFQNIQLGDGVRLFLPNPVDGDSWLRTDHTGLLRYRPIGAAQEGVMSHAPFFAGFSVPSIDQNKNRIVELDWSADGRQFSFRIAPPPGTDNANAGVWFWQPRTDSQYDPTYPIIRDCPTSDYISCQIVQPSNAGHWSTRAVSWSPISGDNTILLTVALPDERRNALAITQAVRSDSAHQASRAPHFVRYDFGHWNLDGQGIIVSGRRPDARVIIGEVNNDLSGERIILDGSARGLWLRDAVRRPNGQVVALGRPDLQLSEPVALYNSAGAQISGYIGEAAPEDVRWFPDRSMALVSVRGRQYVVQVDGGSITDVTDRLSDPQFTEGAVGSTTIPSAVVEGSEYIPGQQLRMRQTLNIRGGPGTSKAIVGQLQSGDYVAILAGPHRESRYEWWQVQTASNLVGWIAAKIDGNPTVSRI